MNETPNTVHGRLLESAHIAGYTFKRAWDELRWLLEDERWQQLGFSDGAAFAESIYGLFSEFRGTVEQRKEVANALAGIASQRAIAKVLGVGTGTVARDLGAPSGARQAAKPKESEATEAQAAPNGAPWFADDADPTKLAKLREKSKKKRDERQALHATLAKQNAALPISERKYSAIYADPPWRFETWGELGKTLSAKLTTRRSI
jgi:hypothetical protein